VHRGRCGQTHDDLSYIHVWRTHFIDKVTPSSACVVAKLLTRVFMKLAPPGPPSKLAYTKERMTSNTKGMDP
jgi:hypothetical protein